MGSQLDICRLALYFKITPGSGQGDHIRHGKFKIESTTYKVTVPYLIYLSFAIIYKNYINIIYKYKYNNTVIFVGHTTHQLDVKI